MRPLGRSIVLAALVGASPAEAQAPAAAEPEVPFAHGSQVGVHLAVCVQLGGGTGYGWSPGVRAGRVALSWEDWEHRQADGDEAWVRFQGFRLAWFAWPLPWGGPHLAAALGELRYEVDGTAWGQPGAPHFSRGATTAELEAGVTLLAPRGWTNALAVAVVAVVPLEHPELPLGVDLTAPALMLRVELNPLLMGGAAW